LAITVWAGERAEQMHPVDRRRVLGALAASVVLGLVNVVGRNDSQGLTKLPPRPTVPPPPGPHFSAPRGAAKVAVPHGTIYKLSGRGNQVALTVDDGTDPDVVAAYAALARRTGLRLTFFVNGQMTSWTDHAALLRPLVDDGQVFMANHTWSHQDLTTLTAEQITDEVTRNETFLDNTYGTLGRPFLRPPYGNLSEPVSAQLDDLGYPAKTMWYGTLGDATEVSASTILANARTWLQPENLVIGHANHPPVIEVLDQIAALIAERKLQPVHLGDVFAV
jgi:peptidoglycan-N-acetylglucosamine deacetylase